MVFWGAKNIAGESSLKYLMAPKLLTTPRSTISESIQESRLATLDQQITIKMVNNVSMFGSTSLLVG